MLEVCISVEEKKKTKCAVVVFLKISEFAVDRLNMFGGVDEAPCKVAGHELKSLVQIMECQVPGLRYPLLCIIDYLGFRLIAMSTLPIKGRASLIYGSMDGGKTVATSPETVELTKILGKKLNLKVQKNFFFLFRVNVSKEHGLRHQPESTRIRTPADLELHRGTDGHIYALDFSRLFPPDVAEERFLVVFLGVVFFLNFEMLLQPSWGCILSTAAS